MLKVLMTLGACIAAAGCLTDRKELSRITSPNGKLDAVISSSDGGATTSTGYFVSVVSAGNGAGTMDQSRVFAINRVPENSIHLSWEGSGALVIVFEPGHVLQQKRTLELQAAGETVQVEIRYYSRNEWNPAGPIQKQ